MSWAVLETIAPRAGSAGARLMGAVLALGLATAGAQAECPHGANCREEHPSRAAPDPRPPQYAPPPQFQAPRPPQYAPRYEPPPHYQAPRQQPQPERAAPGPGFREGAWPPRPAAPPARDPHAGVYVYQGRSFAPFRVARYRWPAHMHYHRYGVGAYFPLTLLIVDYVILDWTDYGLAAPPDGYAWVRYGPDILLVNQDSGAIGDAAYGAFVETPDADDQPPADADDPDEP
jgi:Ni/Co efflux regulator RcnB